MTKRKRNTDNLFESLLAGGVIGAALGAILSKDKGTGATIGAIAGAALVASSKSYDLAKKTEIPLVMEEGDALYKVYTNGSKKLIKRLPKSDKTLPEKFTLK